MLFRAPEPLVNIGQFLKQITASPTSGSRRSPGFPLPDSLQPVKFPSLPKYLLHFRVGKEAVVGTLEPGQFFGEGCLNGHPLGIATTTAMEECVIISIIKEAMIATLHTEPKFSELFIAYLLTRNSRVEEDLIDQLFNSSEKRLARLLLLLAHFGKEGVVSTR